MPADQKITLPAAFRVADGKLVLAGEPDIEDVANAAIDWATERVYIAARRFVQAFEASDDRPSDALGDLQEASKRYSQTMDLLEAADHARQQTATEQIDSILDNL